MRHARFAGVIALSFAFFFATVDRDKKRHVYGPYKTQKECTTQRSIEVMTDRWLSVSECEER